MVSDNVIEQNLREEGRKTILDDLEFGPEDQVAPTAPETTEEPSETGLTRDISLLDSLTFDPVEENSNAIQGVPLDAMVPEAKAEIENEAKQLELLAKSIYDDEQIEAIKAKGPIGFWEAKDFLDYEDVAPGGGVTQAVEAAGLLKAADNLKNGKELSVGQQELMRQFVKERVEIGLRTMSTGGSIATGLMQMPAFAVEFIASGGAGKVLQVAATKGAAKKAQTAAVGVITTSLAPAVLPRYAAKVGERRVNQSMTITDKGDLIAKEGVESPAKGALMAFGHHVIEVGSEMSGGAIAEGAKYILKPVSKVTGPLVSETITPVLKSTVMSGITKLPPSVRSAIFRAVKETNPNATVGKVFSQAGWNGVLEELGEERLSQILSGTLDLVGDDSVTMDNYWEAIVPDKNQLMVEAGMIGIARGTMSAATIGVNLLETKLGSREEAQQAVDNMTVGELENFVEENTKPRKAPGDISTAETQVDFEVSSWELVKKRLAGALQNFQVAFTNDIQPLEDLDKLATKNGYDNKKLTNTAIRFRANSKLAATILTSGPVKFNPETGSNEKAGLGYEEVLGGFDAGLIHVEPDTPTRHQDFQDYRAAMSTLDDVALEDVTVSPEAQAKAESDLQRLEEKYGEEFITVQDLAKDSTKFLQQQLHTYVDAGIMTQEAYDAMLEARPNYSPLLREVSEEIEKTTGFPLSSMANVLELGDSLKKRTGSDKEIKSIDDSVVDFVMTSTRVTEAAKISKAIADLSDFVPELVQKIPAPQGGAKFLPEDVLPYWENGEVKYIQVDPTISNTIKNVESVIPPNVLIKLIDKTFKGTASTLRTGATANPEFSVRNFIRDTFTVYINSGGKVKPTDVLKSIYQISRGKSSVEQFHRDGGGFLTVRDIKSKEDISAIKRALKVNQASYKALDPPGKLKKVLDANGSRVGPLHYINPLFIMGKVNNSLELAPRLALYDRLRAEGLDGIEAAVEARDITLDFQRGGTATKWLNQYSVFLNASVQGIDKIVRSIKDNPKKTLTAAAVSVTLPQILLSSWYLYGADEETRDKYLEIPDWQRNLFWPLVTDGQVRGYVPKPFTFGFFFGTLPEKGMIASALTEDDVETRDFWKSTFKEAYGASSPVGDLASLVPIALKVPMELSANFSSFFEGPITSPYKESGPSAVLPEDRKSLRSSTTAVEIGELFGVSPDKVDFTINSLFGGAGKDWAVPLSDAVLESIKTLNGEEVIEKPDKPGNLPVVRAFVKPQPEGTRSKSVQNFYSNLDESRQYANSYELKLEESTEKGDKFYTENKSIIEGRASLEDYNRDLSELNKEIREIKADPSKDGAEKLLLILDLEEELTAIAKEANKTYKEIKKE